MSETAQKRHTFVVSGPSPWVRRWSELITVDARVLDFACGTGRNLPPLLERGARVIAADRDDQALALVKQHHPRVACVCSDLENHPWPFAPGSFDALVCCNFLHRPRLDLLIGLLAPAGVLIYETFAIGNERYGKPSNPAFLLAEGELQRVASRNRLQTLAYEHGLSGGPRPAMVQRICAVRAGRDAETCPLVG
ncbi:MAG: class I SAM-dependent methyltransferase [Quisquiliibacterium sp.]